MSTALPLANFITDFWDDHLVAHDRQGVFLVLVGFVGSFAFIRMSTRMIRAEVSWWPGNIESESGLHVHHLVFGIMTMMVAGTLGFAAFGHSPLTEICAFFFGIGAGLTIDEFALWVYLEDVYWAEQGRSSIDATVIAAALIGLIVIGANPFELSKDGEGLAVETIVTWMLGPRRRGASSRGGGCTGSRGLLPAAGDLRRLPDRQAALRLGPPSLRRAAPKKQAKAEGAVPSRPAHRALQGSLPRHRRRQAERGPRARDRRGGRRDPPGRRRNARESRTPRPSETTDDVDGPKT